MGRPRVKYGESPVKNLALLVRGFYEEGQVGGDMRITVHIDYSDDAGKLLAAFRDGMDSTDFNDGQVPHLKVAEGFRIAGVKVDFVIEEKVLYPEGART